jgi:menaquinone-dependent protoporphyrinogen oxidase
MADKVLLAYASKYGATQEIAEKIGEVLQKDGISIDILPLKKVKKLADYRAVIIGSAVYIGQWYKPTTKFLRKNAGVLADMPVWLFSAGPSGKGDPVELLSGWKYPVMLQSVIDNIKPRDIAVFGGNLKEEKISGLEKWVVKRVGGSFGDFRDWDMINAWAKKVAAEIKKK